MRELAGETEERVARNLADSDSRELADRNRTRGERQRGSRTNEMEKTKSFSRAPARFLRAIEHASNGLQLAEAVLLLLAHTKIRERKRHLSRQKGSSRRSRRIDSVSYIYRLSNRIDLSNMETLPNLFADP